MVKAGSVSVGEYVLRINRALAPSRRPRHTVLDIFAGCGGLSLVFESAGFRSAGIESDARCCETYNANLWGSCANGVITPDTELPNADVVVGGPPCQPFSVFGSQDVVGDPRNGFPSFVSAVRGLGRACGCSRTCAGWCTRTGGTSSPSSPSCAGSARPSTAACSTRPATASRRTA